MIFFFVAASTDTRSPLEFRCAAHRGWYSPGRSLSAAAGTASPRLPAEVTPQRIRASGPVEDVAARVDVGLDLRDQVVDRVVSDLPAQPFDEVDRHPCAVQFEVVAVEH